MTLRTFLGLVTALALAVKAMCAYAALSQAASSEAMGAFVLTPLLWLAYEVTPLGARRPPHRATAHARRPTVRRPTRAAP
eukprot:5526161-Prymnesium_polylepis.1